MNDPFTDEQRRAALRRKTMVELANLEAIYLVFLHASFQLDNIGAGLEKALNCSLERPEIRLFEHHLSLIHEEMDRRAAEAGVRQ